GVGNLVVGKQPDLSIANALSDDQRPADGVDGIDLGYLDQAEQTFIDKRGSRVVVHTAAGEDECSCADLGQAGAHAVNPAGYVQGGCGGDAVIDAHAHGRGAEGDVAVPGRTVVVQVEGAAFGAAARPA